MDLVEVVSEDEGEDGHELHDNVQGGSGGVLERISDSVSDDGGLVDITSLSLQVTVRGGLLDVLLGIVPGSSSVTHADGQLNTSDKTSDEQTAHGIDTEESSSEEGGEHDHGSGGDHLPETGVGTDLDASIVVRPLSGVLVKQVGALSKLPLDLINHFHGSKSDALHGHGGEPEGDHSSDDQEGKSEGLEHVDSVLEKNINSRVLVVCVFTELLDATDKGSEQGEADKSGRSNGEALSNGGGGVSGSVKSIGLLPDGRVELSHLGDSSSVVADRSVDIDGQSSGEVAQHSNRGKGNTVQISNGEAEVDNSGKDGDRDDGTLVPEGSSVNDVGGSSSLATVSDFPDGLVAVTGVVLGDETNDESSSDSGANAGESFPGLDCDRTFVRNLVQFEAVGQ